MEDTLTPNNLQKVSEKPSAETLLRVLVVIPAYNEEGNIINTLDSVLSLPKNYTALVINDGSGDRTATEVNRTPAFLINLPFNLGIGGAVQTGFKFAAEHNFDVVVQVDGDNQHDVNYIERLIEPIVTNQADMTIGSRFIPPFLGYKSSFVRRIGINFFAKLISFITDYKVTDPTSGFRAYNARMINVFAKYYPQDYPEPEAIVVAGKHKARIQEIPVVMRKRGSGHSSIRYLRTLYYMIKVTFAVILAKLK